MTPFDPRQDLATLRAQYDLIDELLERFGGQLAGAVPAISGWSPEHHLAHVALANELVLRNLKSLAKGEGLLIVRGGEPLAPTVPMLAAGRLPRGKAQAPRMVRPPETVERELLRQWLDDGRRELEALDAAAVVAGELKVPHQLLGPLDAPQWARFAAVHTAHHLTIVLEVLRARAAAEELPAPPRIASLAHGG